MMIPTEGTTTLNIHAAASTVAFCFTSWSHCCFFDHKILTLFQTHILQYVLWRQSYTWFNEKLRRTKIVKFLISLRFLPNSNTVPLWSIALNGCNYQKKKYILLFCLSCHNFIALMVTKSYILQVFDIGNVQLSTFQEKVEAEPNPQRRNCIPQAFISQISQPNFISTASYLNAARESLSLFRGKQESNKTRWRSNRRVTNMRIWRSTEWKWFPCLPLRRQHTRIMLLNQVGLVASVSTITQALNRRKDPQRELSSKGIIK